MNLILREIGEWLEAWVRYCPGSLGRALRRWWFGRKFARLGPKACFEEGVVVTGAANISIGGQFAMMRFGSLDAHNGKLTIGDRSALNFNVCLSAAEGEIELGDNVMVGPNSTFRASNHEFGDPDQPIFKQEHKKGRIVVENDVWIGAHVVVLPDVRIGAHSVVGAGSVVTKDVEPYSVVAGVPARLLSKRK